VTTFLLPGCLAEVIYTKNPANGKVFAGIEIFKRIPCQMEKICYKTIIDDKGNWPKEG
jgi:hypothetical protein